jgi:ribosomal protein S18 acetylase RimI-like enzyme
VIIGSAQPSDAGEILTVQHAAYVTEAQLYGDPHIVPLMDTVDDVRAAVDAGQVLVARDGQRVVGAVRGIVDGAVCTVARLVVAPDVRGRGIGSALLAAVEARDAARVERFVLFTGHRSAGNLRLYRGAGYTDTHVVPVTDTLSMVHLEKRASG